MDHVAGPELAGVEQAGAVLAPTAQAAGAPAEELPPLVLTPALEAAVGRVVSAGIAWRVADRQWCESLVGGSHDIADGWYLSLAKGEAEVALLAAVQALVREVAGDPADRPDQ